MPWELNGNNVNINNDWLGTRNAEPLIIRTQNGGAAPDAAAEAMRITALADGRRVGIGTGTGPTAPGAKLDICGSGHLPNGRVNQCCAPPGVPTLSLAEQSSNPQISRQAWLQFHNAGEAEAYIRLAGGSIIPGSARSGQRRLEIGDNQGVNTGLTVQGNVGIGTTAPDSKLTVHNDGGDGSTGSRPAQIRIHGHTNPNNKLEIGYDTSGNFAVIGALTENVAWRNIILANNGGNVGIGTTAPGAKLDVSGSGGANQCCARVPPTLSLAEASSTRNRQAWLQFHNAGEAEAYIRLAGGGPIESGREGERRLEIGDNQGVNTSLYVAGGLLVNGEVRLGAADQPVRIGGNRLHGFMQLQRNLWFSDPQNGTIEIGDHDNTGWGTMVGFFNRPSSIKYKKDTSVLGASDWTRLLDDALRTDVVQYRYKEDDEASRLRLGVITESCPKYLVGEGGESLSTVEYIAMIHGALKGLVSRVVILEKRLLE